MTRAYDMSRRAESAARTTERIAEATEALLGREQVGDVTLQAIALGAGVTVQTVLRHMGSRDGCFLAVRERLLARIEAQRGQTPPGDVGAALSDLMTHYEAEGRLVLHLLAQESSDPVAREAAATGRGWHRAWVERCFGPLLQACSVEAVDALVAATDLTVWKLLRLDLGRSPEATRAVMERLVRAALEPSCPRS
jgi:AcrR family transcriptional regulator